MIKTKIYQLSVDELLKGGDKVENHGRVLDDKETAYVQGEIAEHLAARDDYSYGLCPEDLKERYRVRASEKIQEK